MWVSPHTDDVLYDCVEEMPKTVVSSWCPGMGTRVVWGSDLVRQNEYASV